MKLLLTILNNPLWVETKIRISRNGSTCWLIAPKAQLLLFFIFISCSVIAQDEKPKYELVPLGNKVNSRFHESSPIISPDGKTLYFIVTNHPDNNLGKDGSQDIWYCERGPDGEWQNAIHMPAPFNRQRYNQVLSVSPDGNSLFLRGGEGKKSDGFSITTKTATGWSEPKAVVVKDYEKMNKGTFSGAFMSFKSNVILFYFNEKEGTKYSDLYISFQEDNNGSYTRPVPMSFFNTRLDEFGPFIAPDDHTLYFASNRPGGLGSMDIYMTKRLDKSWLKWSEPVNIGAPVNTDEFDAYYSIDESDTNAFTTRAFMTADGGSLDILGLKRVKVVKPKIVLSGYVYNEKTNEPVLAEIEIDIEKERLSSFTSNSEGMYKTELPSDGFYFFNVNAEGFLNLTDSLDVFGIKKDTEIYKNLYMKPLEVGVSVRLNNIFFDFDKATLRPESFPELDNVVDMMERNPKLQIAIEGHTDDKGSDEYNRNLSQLRAESVRNYLLEKWVTAERVIANGYGESRPEVPNTSDENRQINRRVVFTVLGN